MIQLGEGIGANFMRSPLVGIGVFCDHQRSGRRHAWALGVDEVLTSGTDLSDCVRSTRGQCSAGQDSLDVVWCEDFPVWDRASVDSEDPGHLIGVLRSCLFVRRSLIGAEGRN